MNKQHAACLTLGNSRRRNSLGSSVITGLERLEETTIRAGGNGDNWHMTWAGNDKQYVGLCDGTAWENVPGYNGRSYNSLWFVPPVHLSPFSLDENLQLMTHFYSLHRYGFFRLIVCL